MTNIIIGLRALTDIPLNIETSSKYGTSPPNNVVNIPPETNARRADSEPLPISDFYHLLDKSFEIPDGSELELYIEMIDSYGLHYRVPLNYNRIYRGSDASIYDKDGNVLWSGNTVWEVE